MIAVVIDSLKWILVCDGVTEVWINDDVRADTKEAQPLLGTAGVG